MSEKPVRQLIAGAESQTEFYPKQLMQNILDGEAGENLYAYLSKFNHINAGYVASATAARNAIPEIYRKTGFIITYYLNEKPTTEQFIGNKEDAGSDNWLDNSYWQLVDGVGEVDSNSITLNQLSKEVIDLLGKGNNSIINYPDGEDLTEVDACGGNSKQEINILKFADKKYSAANFSGLGRKYLRKNLVEVEEADGTKVTKNVLTQEMISDANTRYIIQYDYDLNDAEITIPEGCVLDFQGGSFSNGNIIGNNTNIISSDKLIFNIDCEKYYIDGSWNIRYWNVYWFGAINDGDYSINDKNYIYTGTDNFNSFQAALNASYKTNINITYIPIGNYRISKPLMIGYDAYSSVSIIGETSMFFINNKNIGVKLFFDNIIGGLFVNACIGSTIKNISIFGNGIAYDSIIANKNINEIDFYNKDIKNNGVYNQGIALSCLYHNTEYIKWYIPPFKYNEDINGFNTKITIENVIIESFYIGIGVQTNEYSGQDDFLNINRCNIAACTKGYCGCGNQQRNTIISNSNIWKCYAALNNYMISSVSPGYTNGQINNCCFDMCYSIFGNMYIISPLVLNDCYAEDLYIIGYPNVGTDSGILIFNNCDFHLYQIKSLKIISIFSTSLDNNIIKYIFNNTTIDYLCDDIDVVNFLIGPIRINRLLNSPIDRNNIVYGVNLIDTDNTFNFKYSPFEGTVNSFNGLDTTLNISAGYINYKNVTIGDFLIIINSDNSKTYLLKVINKEEQNITLRLCTNISGNIPISVPTGYCIFYKLYKPNGFFNSLIKNITNGNSDNRPIETIPIGFRYFDTTLNKPIWWNNTKWVDATGADV